MKIKKAYRAVVDGTRDYADEKKRLSKQAEKNAGYGAGSMGLDVGNHARELDRLMREQNVSWRGSIKKRFKAK